MSNNKNKSNEPVGSDNIKTLIKWVKNGTNKPKQSASIIDDKFMEKLARQQGVKRFRY